jgi:hypothetical protein
VRPDCIWKSRELTTNARPTADRDRAIILLLADTGMRATELCNIQMKDVNLNNHSIKIVGKGNKERIDFFGKRTGKALWKHLLPRLNTDQPQDYLFAVDFPRDPRKMRRGVLMHLLKRIGERAAVLDANLIYLNFADFCNPNPDTGIGAGLLIDQASDATLTNNVIAENQAQVAGSGLYVSGSSPRLLHNTLAHNLGSDGTGLHVVDRFGVFSTVRLTNTI